MSAEAFYPNVATVEIGGAAITLRDITMRDYPRFLEAARVLFEDAMSGNLAGALAEHADQMITCVLIGSDATRAQIDEMAPDDFIRLASEVAARNADFFVSRLQPEVSKTALRLLGSIRPNTGPASSPG
jgi:hypothetical protein